MFRDKYLDFGVILNHYALEFIVVEYGAKMELINFRSISEFWGTKIAMFIVNGIENGFMTSN